MADLATKKFYIFNQAICKMLGYSRKEFEKLGVRDIHPEKDLPYVLGQFERQSKGAIGENILAENMPVKRKDGSIFYTNISASRVKLAKRMYLMGIFRDITEQRRINKNLEDAKVAARNVLEDLQVEKKSLAYAKAKDEALLASIGDGVVATNQAGKIVLMNKAAGRMLGWSAKQVTGRLFVEVWQVLDEKGNLVPEAKRPVTLALTGKITTTTTTTTTGSGYFYTRKDGTKFPVALTVTPVLVGNKIIGAIDVFRDITREKEIEKLRLDFLSLASHQLRTPLSGTKWLIETIQRGIIGELNPKQKEYINSIYQINERMIRLVSDMLDVLMLESGVTAIKKQEVSVSKIFEELLLMMEPASRDKGIMLCNLLKNHKSFFLETDLQILRSILECFVSNAINYSQSGQKVFLDAKEESDLVVFSVKDSGIGIPKEEQKSIFERFYRASNAKALRPTGTGLGLNIAKMLAEKINAKVSFESQKNKGSIFYLCIPKRSSRGVKEKEKIKN